jgi:hypothetical protein
VRILTEFLKRCNGNRAILGVFLTARVQNSLDLRSKMRFIRSAFSANFRLTAMKNRPIHENLDTSFVNLPALIKYLRRRQFVGRVRVELSGYEADIELTTENQLRVREYDHIAGRVAEGEEALQRILIRSREPGGIINVYQTSGESQPIIEKKEIVAEEKKIIPEIKIANGNGKAKADFLVNGNLPKEEKSVPTKTVLPNLPFEFTNKFEAKAKQKTLSAEEQTVLFNLIGELLGTIDHSLAMAKLNFPTAFQKACKEISADYPFLMSFEYHKGKITLAEPPNAKIFVVGILEVLKRILEKLGANPKFAEVYRYTTQRILALTHQRKSYYEKYSIVPALQKILGA